MLNFIGKDKFVYVSFGASTNLSNAPIEVQEKFIQAFKESKEMKFLWKWEGDSSVLKIPSNVFVAEWMPQQDVLGKIMCFFLQKSL